MKTFLASLIIFFAFISISQAQLPPPPFGTEPSCDLILSARFETAKIKICGVPLDVEIADNEVLTSFGLMCRDSLPENSGMLFIFKEERQLSFWMKNTRIPLSIGYLDKNKVLIDIHEMKAMDQTSVPSSKPAIYAIEANKGWFTKNKIKPGCKFEFVKDKKSTSKY